MRTISAANAEELKSAGAKIVGKVKPFSKHTPIKDRPPQPNIEKALARMEHSLSLIAGKKDPSVDIMKSVKEVSTALIYAVAKIREESGPARIRCWNVAVHRGPDNLIQSLKLKAE